MYSPTKEELMADKLGTLIEKLEELVCAHTLAHDLAEQQLKLARKEWLESDDRSVGSPSHQNKEDFDKRYWERYEQLSEVENDLYAARQVAELMEKYDIK